ncbi:MAG: glycoside hydrolase domain-containing protein [Thermoguttaceae bacterium]|jgi:hypothetical protein
MIVTRERVLGLLGLMLALLAPRIAGAEGTPVPAAKPGPLVVWTDTPWQAVTPDTKPPANPALTIKLAAARGGIASGLVLVSGAPGPVVAKAEALKGPGGTIPVQLRYATRRLDMGPAVAGAIGGKKLQDGFVFGSGRFLDALSDTPVADEAIQAVWVTVDVPPTAQPGNYQGAIAVAGKTVDVSVSVADFTVPPPGERRVYAGVHQSPDSVAFRYNVAPWSDEHFKYLERSIQLAGRAGANILYVPVIGFTYFGQRNGLILFTRKGEELVPEFTAFDRYLDLWLKHVGKPHLIVLEVYDIYGNGWYGRNYIARQFPIDGNTLEVTVRESDGSLKQVRTPLYDKVPGTWKALVEGVQRRLAKVGLAKYQVLLGQATDVHVPKATVDFFKSLDPGLRWTAWTHGYGYNGEWGANGNRMGLMSYPSDGCFVSAQRATRGIPNPPGPGTMISLSAMRSCLVGGDQSSFPWRITPDLSGSYGPVGLDLWPLPPLAPTDEEKKNGNFRQGRAWTLKLDYGPNLDRGQPGACTVAGPKGALSTARLEALAEGSCEAEARIRVELAMELLQQIDNATAVPVLAARYNAFNKGLPVLSDWNDSLVALYELAAKAEKILADPGLVAKLRTEIPKKGADNRWREWLRQQLYAFRYVIDRLPQAERNTFLMEIARSGYGGGGWFLREEALRQAVATRPAIEGLGDYLIENARSGDGLGIFHLGSVVGSEKAVPILTELLSNKSTLVVHEAALALLALKTNEVQAAESLSKAFIAAEGGSLERVLWNLDGFVNHSDAAVRKALVPGLSAVLANEKVPGRVRALYAKVLGRLKQDAAPALETLRKLSTHGDKELADAASGAVKAIEVSKP